MNPFPDRFYASIATMHGSTQASDVIFYAVLALIVLASLLRSIWQKRGAAGLQDGPLLSSQEMLGANGLTSVNKATLAGFNYNLLTNDAGRVMFLVQLGHNSWSHIIAYGNKSGLSDMAKSLISKKWLEPANLEGDFPDYFHMYCNPDAQTTVREVFTPDIMAQFVDFCQAYDFELFHDTLYLSLAAGFQDSSDETSLTTDLTNFLQKNAAVLSQL
jgi:hypothetical protein